MPEDRSISIIVPTLNEEHCIEQLIDTLKIQNERIEIIVVDGGSSDRTLSLLSGKAGVMVKHAPQGRATQMNLGAQCASGDTLAFLHADTKVPKDFVQKLTTVPAKKWAYFKVSLGRSKTIYRIIASMMNFRSRVTSVITGDMVLVICKDLYTRINGFPDIPIMEDVEISKRLRRHCKPYSLNSTVITSSRRWDNNGVYKTIFLMWRLRLQYFLGSSPEQLAKKYQQG